MNELIADAQAPSLLFVVVSDKKTIAKCPYFDISVSQDFVEVLSFFCSTPWPVESAYSLSLIANKK